ncbi:Ribonucleotide reductase of class Ia (aerobic), alpha subunit [Salinispira pacifica]|uniref:Ribonucleoside-diphosphate reductase n=2 Tax=Salinispira pacifica TaxID=1307761 RepID=V5WLD2_9SPIO|nr:Ribonucleotide reductase of class Ia (aerobic), alpha subunit [Salinispira pacifica]
MRVSHVRKRDGRQGEFDFSRIRSALSRAFEAGGEGREETGENEHHDKVEATAAEIEKMIRSWEDAQLAAIGPGAELPAIPVEEIQEMAETALMKCGYFETAKRYIRYRYHHGLERRETGRQRKEDAESGKMAVATGSGQRVSFSRENLEAYLNQQRQLLGKVKAAEIDSSRISRMVLEGLGETVSTAELRLLSVQAAAGLIEEDPVYDEYAALLLRQAHARELLASEAGESGYFTAYRQGFIREINRGIELSYFDPRLAEFNVEAMSQAIKPERDMELRYIGSETLRERYLLQIEGKPSETYQGFWMRVAMGLALNEANKEEKALEFYELMSSLRFIPSTPTLFHAGLEHPQLSSCYLSTVNDDLSHIFKVMGDNAALSKWSGGIGNDWTRVRGTGAWIASTKVHSQGVIPFLKIANDVTVAINRSGKRRGATCAYLETWHYDIEDFLDLRRNTGDDRRRTPDMNTANWIPDLFMKRVEAQGEWTLFSPDETPDLHDLYGSDFEKRYEEYEAAAARGEINLFKNVEAEKLWRKMLSRLFETGHPWITFKDPSNIRSPQDHAGVVHNSNLCTEITLNNSSDETAVCNLGSINLPRHLRAISDESGGDNNTGAAFVELDEELIAGTVSTAIRMLDNVIDINYYPTEEARRSNMRHRPIGLGILGFQDALFMQGLGFHHEEALAFADRSMEVISWNAIMASSQLAAEKGAYDSFKGSKWDRGILPQDSLDILEAQRGIDIDVPRGGALDWEPVRQSVKKHGMRNSNTMAIAPTATISNIAGVYPCIEPAYKNLYVKSNMSGEFTVVNRYLVQELKAMDLWNDQIRELLKFRDGSVQEITQIPAELRERYLEAFEIDPVTLLRFTARRSKWIDQSQSHNVFMKGSSGKMLDTIYRSAWRMGLKTTYYLRTLAASQIEKSTLDAKVYGYTQKRGAGASAGGDESSPATGSTPENQPVAKVAGVGLALAAAPMTAVQGAEICNLLDPDCEACQ